MTKFRIKAYTNYGLITSKQMYYEYQIVEALNELNLYATITKVYMTNGKMSKEIKFTTNDKNTRPIYYTRSDGVRTFTLSVHPLNYPMTAYYSNGQIEIIYL